MCSYCRCSFSPTPRRCFFSGIRAPFRSAALADRPDQIPLAHLRAARGVFSVGYFVQLLAVALLERMACAAAAPTASRRLLAEFAARALREARDRALPP